MDVKEKLVELLAKYFDIGDSYAYNLTRVKSAFACGTMGFDDFEEFDEETVAAIADYLISNGVTVQECGHWISLTECANAGVYCSVCHKKVYKEDYAWCNRKNKLRSDYCPHCGAKMTPQPPKGE